MKFNKLYNYLTCVEVRLYINNKIYSKGIIQRYLRIFHILHQLCLFMHLPWIPAIPAKDIPAIFIKAKLPKGKKRENLAN